LLPHGLGVPKISVEIPAMAVPSIFKASAAETGSGCALVQPPAKSAQVMVMLCWPAVKKPAAPPPTVIAS
jgi:hypothetical protein